MIEDVAGAPGLSETDRNSIGSLGFGALVAPALRRGESNPLWTIVSVSATPRRWTPNEISLAEEVAERTWAAVERARAEAALRESEERQAFLLALSDALGALVTPLEIAAVATARLCEHLGVDRVLYGEIAGDRLTVERDHTRGVPSLVGEHSLKPFGPDFLAVYKPGEVILVDDVARDPKRPIRRATRCVAGRSRPLPTPSCSRRAMRSACSPSKAQRLALGRRPRRS
ncbi:hypothetical protein [Rubellimicrobium roseum]|uniref:GAF domain-containing protein n=1 Tax=Rubellimicrobium roseum TaxID=687525 RepID=A0A5C4N7K1_9RHOB|nr:hypothetical protein [Rubellimicrobium roseum]TNC68276.1 hypothetical protein FHG71_14935 [Rubellimicrobium roseum]